MIEYDKLPACDKILSALGLTREGLNLAQQMILNDLPESLNDDQLATAIERVAQAQAIPAQCAPAPDPLRASIEARLEGLESEHQERKRIINWIAQEGGFDHFINKSIGVEHSAQELRSILHPPQQAKAA